MRRFWPSYVTLLLLVAAGGGAAAQEPSFSLSFSAPASIVNTAGAAVQYTATGRLTTTGLGESDRGAQGWSLSMAAEGGEIVLVSTNGTAGADDGPGGPGLRQGGFEKSELTTGAGNEGAVSAVVLSFTEPITLPPTGSAELVALIVEAAVPDPGVDEAGDPTCEPLESRVLFVDGRRGSGQPVDNKITYRGTTFIPGVGDASTSICPRVIKPLVLSAVVLSPAAAAGEKQGADTPWTIEVPVGTASVPVTVGISLSSNLDADAGAQGWSMSVLTGECFAISDATTTGTTVDAKFDGGFKKTEIVNPGINGGQQGAVSAIVLSFTSPITLDPVGEALLLQVSGSLDASTVDAPGASTAPCPVSPSDPDQPGLRGSGQPVRTAVTVDGQTRRPGICGASISVVGARQGRFVRGNPNDDSKIDIADAIWIINDLFREGPSSACLDASDTNNDGFVDSSDALYLIDYEFRGGPEPPPPFAGGCGTDPEGDDDGIPCDASQTNC